MFKFLKDKLKSAISKISEGVEKEGQIEEKIIETKAEPPKEEKGFFARLKQKITGKEEKIEEIKEIPEEKKPAHTEHIKEEKHETELETKKKKSKKKSEKQKKK